MPKITQALTLSFIVFLNTVVLGQAEFVLTYNGNPINLNDGLELRKVTYPLVRLELGGDVEDLSDEIRLELTLIRKGRAVRAIRGNIIKGKKMSIKGILDIAKAGDEIMITTNGNYSGLKNNSIKFSVR